MKMRILLTLPIVCEFSLSAVESHCSQFTRELLVKVSIDCNACGTPFCATPAKKRPASRVTGSFQDIEHHVLISHHHSVAEVLAYCLLYNDTRQKTTAMVAAPMESDNADAADASVFDTFTAGAAEAGDPGNPSNDDDEFDPFHIGEAAEPKSPVKKPQGEQKPDKKTENKMNSSASVASNMSTALPPRLVVKFKVHEEIASCFKPTSEQEGASDVFVQGTVLVRNSESALYLFYIAILSYS